MVASPHGKRPVADSQQYRDVVAVPVRHDKVGHLVTVEVSDGYTGRVVASGIIHCGGKRSIAEP